MNKYIILAIVFLVGVFIYIFFMTNKKIEGFSQVPINEIKRYLIKHGFIKIGTTAPNDVLRKMYESAMLICGEVKNHNPDNLLYNYLNGSHNE